MAYETDPDVAAFLGGTSQKSVKREPTFDEIKAAKKSYSGVNPQLQPDSDFNYAQDPDVSAFLTTSTTKAAKEPGLVDRAIKTAFELKQAAPATAASALDVIAGLPSMVAGTVGYGAGRLFGLSPEEATAASQKVAGKIAEPVGQLTRTAGTQAYKQSLPSQAMQKVGEFAQKNIVEPVAARTGANETDIQNALNAAMLGAPAAGRAVGRGLAEAKAALPTVRVEPTGKPTAMQSGGAAAATNKAILDEAINRASPELAAQLKKENPATIDPVALERYVDADSVGVRLTKGQALQDPTLISNERNARGQDPQLAERFNEQNKALLEKAAEVKEKAAPDVYAPDYVANAEGALEYISGKVKQNESATAEAYKALDEFGAGKIQVDSKSFADNAMKALSEKEDIDFLPSTIANKVKSYQEGKSMNFDQYENLRTQIARETRKAQQAGDGNAAHALSLVRGELEKLPLIGETAEAKPLADKARATAKAEFDLVNRSNPAYNKVYADYVNGAVDTKDFIQSAVLRSKNKDFAKTMELFDDPVAKQNLRAGALDLIIKDSTDTSGNFKPARFAKAIENLDVNKKLDALFGEEAQTLRKIAKTGQLVEARPAGAFVNESNTAVTQMAGEYAKRLATKTPLVGGLVEPALNIMAEKSAKKAVAESLRPGAGVKLKNVGKE